MTSPCITCTAETGRHPGCHDKCPGYRAWKVEREQIKEKEKEYYAPAETLAAGRARWYQVERQMKHARRKGS